VKPFVHRELLERGLEALPPADDETVHEMDEADDLALETLLFGQEGTGVDAEQDTTSEQDE
jgi:hypothetical protein